MIDNTEESYKTNLNVAGFAPATEAQAIYDDAERKYGPAFAQYCVDTLLGEDDSRPKALPQNFHMNNLIRLTGQLNNLSQVCSADFFKDWGAEDKLCFMMLIEAVSNDLTQALEYSLKEIAGNDETSNSL
jgi:hypothetical protein